MPVRLRREEVVTIGVLAEKGQSRSEIALTLAGENPGWRQGLAGLVQGFPWAGECVPFRDKMGSS